MCLLYYFKKYIFAQHRQIIRLCRTTKMSINTVFTYETTCHLTKLLVYDKLISAAKNVWRRGASNCNEYIFKHSAGTETQE